MTDPSGGHGPPAVAFLSATAAVVTDDAARVLALLIALVSAYIMVVRFRWDWQDRRVRERRGVDRRKRPGASP